MVFRQALMDLSQLLPRIDKDSYLVAHLCDGRGEAVKSIISSPIRIVKNDSVKLGIRGQSPVDFPDFTN